METLLRDIRYGTRSLLKRPGFTAVVVIMLALGIGANTAIFTVVNAVMLRALPVKDPQQLVFLSNPDRHGVNGGQETGNRFLFSYHEFEWLRDHNQVFSGVFAVQSALSAQAVRVEGANQGSETEHARISAVSGAYFSNLGVNPVRGQTFSEEIDKAKGANPVAVISYGYWKNRFASDPAILGRRIRVRKTSFEIIGVTPPEFSGETVGGATEGCQEQIHVVAGHGATETRCNGGTGTSRHQVQNAGPERLSVFRRGYNSGGMKGYWRAWLDLQRERIDRGGINPFYLAQVYAFLGDRDQAFACLKIALEDHSLEVPALRLSPNFEELRKDARYVTLLQRIGLKL